MLLRLVCRNGLHKHDFWEIIKSKTRHSYEAHSYLRHIGFVKWFQSIESLFGGNWANGPFVKDKCPCQFSHGRERSLSMYGDWWGGKHAHIDTFVTHCACRVQCWDKVKDIDGSLGNMLNVFSVLCVTRSLSNGTFIGSILRSSTIQLYEEVPPHFSGSYMSYVFIVDVRKTWERTATLNGRVHKVWRS